MVIEYAVSQFNCSLHKPVVKWSKVYHLTIKMIIKVWIIIKITCLFTSASISVAKKKCDMFVSEDFTSHQKKRINIPSLYHPLHTNYPNAFKILFYSKNMNGSRR